MKTFLFWSSLLLVCLGFNFLLVKITRRKSKNFFKRLLARQTESTSYFHFKFNFIYLFGITLMSVGRND